MQGPRTPDPRTAPLSIEDRRWLHDKYQRFDQNEAQLADYRSSYIAAVTTGLIAAMVYAVVNLLPRGQLAFATTVSLLAVFGIAISAVWAVVVRRTTDAQNLWREAAFQLEAEAPPVSGSLRTSVAVRGNRRVEVDLTLPYHAHEARFSWSAGTPWLDQVQPSELTSDVPLLLIVVWSSVLVVVWSWVALGH